MFVRQVTLQLGQDALGVCPQLPALNERFCGLHAFFAFLRALSEEHKAIYCNIPEGIFVISAYAEHDQIAVGGNIAHLALGNFRGCCSGEGQIVKDRCDAPVPKRVDVVMGPVVPAPVSFFGAFVVVVACTVACREGVSEQGYYGEFVTARRGVPACRLSCSECQEYCVYM